MPEPTEPMPTKEEMLAQGVPPELVEQIFTQAGMVNPNTAAAMQQYSKAKSLRALAQDAGAKNLFGVAARGLAGYGAGKSEMEYSKGLREHAAGEAGINRGWYDAYKKKKFPSGGAMGTTLRDPELVGGGGGGNEGYE